MSTMKDWIIAAVWMTLCLGLVLWIGRAWGSTITPSVVGPYEYCQAEHPGSKAVSAYIDAEGMLVIVCAPPHQLPTPKQAARWCEEAFGTSLIGVLATGYVHCVPPPKREKL